MAEQQFKIFESIYDSERKQRGVYCKIIIHAEDGDIYIPLNMIICAKITERMDYFFYAGSVEFLDIESIIEKNKVNGNEKVTVKIGTNIENTNNFKMKIWNISHKPLHTSQLGNRIIKLSLISDITDKNIKTHWVFNDEPIDKCVERIITEALESEADIHETIKEKLYDKYDKKYILPWVIPQNAIYHLRQFAVNKKFNTTDYFIYQNHENKFCFHSLSELRSKKHKEEFMDAEKYKNFDPKLNKMIDKFIIKVDPGFTFYNSLKTQATGYDYWHMKYVKKIDKFSDNFTKSKLENNNGGFPILKENEEDTNKLIIDYFLYEDNPWCDAFSKNDLFLTCYRLLFGQFTTFANVNRKPGDVIKMKVVHSGDSDEPLRNKLFNGGALIWGITHVIYQSQYIQKLTFYKDRYYDASKGLII